LAEFHIDQWIARQIARMGTLGRAFRRGNTEDQHRVARFIVARLPISDTNKRNVLSWISNRLLDRKRRSARAQIENAQSEWNRKGHRRLERLLDGQENLEFPESAAPLVSFILVTRNKAHLSVLSLESVIRFAPPPYELIVVDNDSTDSTLVMLDRVKGAKVLSNSSNVGFGPACMQAAALARGQYLCFFNNDALLTPGSIEAVLKNFSREDVGAVGGKILLSDGRLQEAGSIVWSDGSALGYGRGENPESPEYNFRRPVDYCSAVFLMTPREVFQRYGGFSEEFAPAYYEDTDYCMTLWQNGLRVIYEPLAQIDHYESASSGGNDNARAMMAAHQVKFAGKWALQLKAHYAPQPENVCAARIAVKSRELRIVYIDDRIPKRALGAGFPRSNDIVTSLARMGHHVVCSTSTFPLTDDGHEDLPYEVEIFDGFSHRLKLVREYLPCANIVWVSRPHNLKLLLNDFPDVFASREFALIYDAEAIFSQRERDRQNLLGSADNPMSDLEPRDLEEERSLARAADVVVVVSQADRRIMQEGGMQSVHVVGHSISANPTPASFEDRGAFLFVGAVHGSDNPNADSVRDFCHNHWPKIHRDTGATFIVAGYGTELLRCEIQDPSVQILGKQDDLRLLYDRARVFVIPTRYAAGIPFKAHEAAAFGVPLVVSPLIAKQLGWSNSIEYLAASAIDSLTACCVRLYNDHQLWEQIRVNALARVAAELSPTMFATNLRSILSDVTSSTMTKVNRLIG
jgi:GT2 family glycosyltransferase/glycosyltransferase involved in cell wall biosynthesis